MITEVSELRNHVSRVDSMNMLVVTSAEAYGYDEGPAGEARYAPLWAAQSIQLEGFVLHPRRLECEPFEVVCDDKDDAEFLVRVIRESAGALALRQADGLALANEGNRTDGLVLFGKPQPPKKVLDAGPLVGLHKNIGGKS